MADRAGRGWAAAIAVALGVAGGSAFAGAAQDRIFALTVLESIPTGQTILFDHSREVGIETEHLPSIADGRVAITLVEEEAGSRKAQVVLFNESREQRFNPFPADGGNPLLMVFMETAVRGMATLTGGSPFYIRNRMREAVRTQDRGSPIEFDYEGHRVAGERFLFRPFDQDPNRERMGAFANLEISFVVSADVPGTFAALAARTAPDANGKHLLAETMILQGVTLSE